VQIGVITYAFRSIQDKSALKILQYCVDSGVSTIEFMGGPAEIYAGIPSGTPATADIIKQNIGGKSTSRPLDFSRATIGDGGGWGSYPGNEEQRKWRASVPMTKFEELRKIYNDAGVDIHMLKVSPATWSDEEIDYAFKMGKAMGARALSDELDWVEGAVPRLASFAEKHGMFAAFHVHQQFGYEGFTVDPYLAISPAVMICFDAGHYYGATGLNPCGYIEKYHDRIFSIHLKDKTGPNTDPPNTNQVWGQGETPLEDILLLLKEHAGEEDWPKYVDIELEYPVPQWSNPVKEVSKCLRYAKNILVCD
jgi:sugar phosphate isomerase/epimerase